ncbi:MAG: site-specific DNA-methyltransferase [Candidatus Poribacteria bacterium]|nr:site-specific DNA-methyltransferase [Candidatus Poribacteria bacterium]
MATKKRTTQEKEVQDYRHDNAKRKNNPPAGIAAQGKIHEKPKQEYVYNPHFPPNLRFDPNGDADKLPELLQKAQREVLSAEEAKTIADALKHHEPWLEWAGKQEKKSFAVDPVALHIHERVSAKAILKVAKRENVQRNLFADPQLTYDKALDYYQRDVEWANRLILGDSLTVMSSLAHREDLAGKVQMIYIDPPYAIKYASNFQSTVFQRNVSDRPQDLTREQEQIKAFRDTWTLGVHSYLAYLRDRLIVAKDLLHDSGSVFVQINDDHVHLVRCLLDDVFGSENFASIITWTRGEMTSSTGLAAISDYLLWYSKDKDQMKYRQLWNEFDECTPDPLLDSYTQVELPNRIRRRMTKEEVENPGLLPEGSRRFVDYSITSQTGGSATYEYEFEGRTYTPPGDRGWSTNRDGLDRLARQRRLIGTENALRYIRYAGDFPGRSITNQWTDTAGSRPGRMYVVETNPKVIQRCMLMTTDPGDLVLDPTCGGGTTAFVAEQWGRRWLTIDTSRVAIAITRQRLLTATFDCYKLKDESNGIAGGFINKVVPHIMLKNIAQNTALDPIFEKHEPILKDKLETLNNTLAEVTQEIRTKLHAKLAEKEKREGKRSITDADRRRWQLPDEVWQEWEVPFDIDPDWPESLQDVLTDYRNHWREKMDEINECIAASSEGEELVDQPEVDRKRIRVSGPFTVEAVQPAEESLDADSPIGGEPEEATDTFEDEEEGHEAVNAEAYLHKIIRLLKNDGVRFPDNKTMKFATLDPLEGDVLHAEGSWEDDETERRVAVAFGPQHGPVTAMQVEQCLRTAYRYGFDDLVFAGFSFDDAAQTAIQKDLNPSVRTHMAHINPDVVMGDLLKETPASCLPCSDCRVQNSNH